MNFLMKRSKRAPCVVPALVARRLYSHSYAACHCPQGNNLKTMMFLYLQIGLDPGDLEIRVGDTEVEVGLRNLSDSDMTRTNIYFRLKLGSISA